MFKTIKKYVSDIGYSFRVVFDASKSLFIAKMILTFVEALFPYIPLFFWRQLINLLTNYISSPEKIVNLLRIIWIFAAIYCLMLLLEKAISAASTFVAYKYDDAINYYLDTLMIRKVSGMDLELYDSSSLREVVSNSWQLLSSMQNMTGLIFRLLMLAIRFVMSALLVMELEWWLILLVLLCSIPVIVQDRRKNQIEYDFSRQNICSKRKMEYYKDLFFEDTRQELWLYGLTDHFIKKYTRLWHEFEHAIHKKDVREMRMKLVSLFFITVPEFAMYAVSIRKLVSRKMAVGDISYYVSLLSQFRSDFSALCFCLNQLKITSVKLNDIRAFLEIKTLAEKNGSRIPDPKNTIEFQNVSFHYPGSEKDIIKNCSFKISSDETVGLVGLNGSGKSTIVKLLCRFYDPTEGRILMNGVDLKDYDITALRKMFGVLFQDYVRYSFTLRENIALSDIENIGNDEKIIEACRFSRSTDFMDGWEEGIDEELTHRFEEHGKELSGGQWQRVSLARTYFKNAPIIILDEPSAALDPVAENEIFQDFQRISKDKSAVLITHRLSSIRPVDKILVLENGRIIEQGSHAELMDARGRYAYLFHLQAEKYEFGS